MTGQPDIAAALAWSGEAARAAANAQAALRGEPVPALLISSQRADEVHPRLCSLPPGHAGGHWWDESKAADLAEAEASPANPYGSTHTRECLALINRSSSQCICGGKHGRFDAASAAEAGRCMALYVLHPGSCYVCNMPAGHTGEHAALDGDGHVLLDWPQEAWSPASHLCPAQWGEPPETMLCSLPSGHDGNHATAEGVEWGGKWETAEPGDVTS